jgi:oxalate decarboxylase
MPETDATPDKPNMLRRQILAGGVAAGAALFAAQARAQSAASTAAGQANGSAGNPGPENRTIADGNPDAFMPPVTDHGGVPIFWHSFSLSHRRIQDGGWARQVNVEDFPFSKDIAGVNMKLNAGGVRELHWHAADEWALMLTGNCRLTAIDLEGRSFVHDVTAGDLWYFPQGMPHSLQGLGPDGCEFLLVFDDGKFSENNTTLLTDWAIHTPREVLAKNLAVSEAALDPLKSVPPEGRYIFQAPVPPELEKDAQAAAAGNDRSPSVFNFGLLAMKPTKSGKSGSVRIVDSSNFPAAANIAAAYVTVKPGGLRELHWHPNADEWQYYISGKGRMTLFMNKADARTADFAAGDVGYVPKTLGHYIENTGDTDLVFLEMFKADRYADLSLNDWLTHLPPELVAQHLGFSAETMAAIPKGNFAVLPEEA